MTKLQNFNSCEVYVQFQWKILALPDSSQILVSMGAIRWNLSCEQKIRRRQCLDTFLNQNEYFSVFKKLKHHYQFPLALESAYICQPITPESSTKIDSIFSFKWYSKYKTTASIYKWKNLNYHFSNHQPYIDFIPMKVVFSNKLQTNNFFFPKNYSYWSREFLHYYNILR